MAGARVVTDPRAVRRRLRAAIAAGTATGTFLKLPSAHGVELADAAGLDVVVVDLEHSELDDGDASVLLAHAAALGLPALVRVAAVEPARIARFLDAGAAGVQLADVHDPQQVDGLLAATRHPPHGRRGVSLATRGAGHGTISLADHLAAEGADPPVLVGQLERAGRSVAEVAALVAGLDVAFVGRTDLAVDGGLVGDEAALHDEVARLVAAVVAAGTSPGGWLPGRGDPARTGLADVAYRLVGSDLQLLADGLCGLRRASRPAPEPST